MRYFLDTEFIEGISKPLIGKSRHFIDLISIGIIREDGVRYYAISTEFNPKDANELVKKNVLSKLPPRHYDQADSPRTKEEAQAWKSNKQIKEDLLQFFGCWRDQHFYRSPDGIEIYGYYADYDWVVFCSLFGRMIDLPKGFPMYCRDLKQMMDDKDLAKEWKQQMCPDPEGEHNALVDAKWNKKLYELITLEKA